MDCKCGEEKKKREEDNFKFVFQLFGSAQMRIVENSWHGNENLNSIINDMSIHKIKELHNEKRAVRTTSMYRKHLSSSGAFHFQMKSQ